MREKAEIEGKEEMGAGRKEEKSKREWRQQMEKRNRDVNGWRRRRKGVTRLGMRERAEIEGIEEMGAGREEKRNEQDEKRRRGEQERGWEQYGKRGWENRKGRRESGDKTQRVLQMSHQVDHLGQKQPKTSQMSH